MPRVYTSQSSIHGTGVFAADHLMPGEIVLKIDDSRVSTDTDPLDTEQGEQEHHCDYLADGKVVRLQPPRTIHQPPLRPEDPRPHDRW